MIVQCPYCATSYELDAARLTGKNPMLKCSRCQRIFPAPTPKKRPAPTPPVAAETTPAADKNLTLPFDEPTWKEQTPPTHSDELTVSEPEETFTLGVEEKSEEFSLPDDAAEEPDTPVMTHTAPIRMEEEEEDEEEDEVEVVPRRRAAVREPRRREPSAIGPIFIFLAIVVAAYGLLARALFASPVLCDRLIGRLPIIGRLGDDRLLTRKVALSDVVGNYQRIKDGKEVFVITGKALNTAPVALHSVQIGGKLYGRDGRALEEKIIYCGNVISAKVLKDLTPRELSILQKLNPPKRFMIEPGESSTFVIVFMDPPREPAEFSAQVVAAQHQV
ncbi:MAG: DUF3426 domain-containing protein [Candidatus Binatia bacterium]